MKLNFFGYYVDYDGYGRWNSRLVKSLFRNGIQVKAGTLMHLEMPLWLQEKEGIDWSALSISSCPPYAFIRAPGRHWLMTMTEGSIVPQKWVNIINEGGIERVLVPCQHNKDAFERSGVTVPISIIPGGTDPDEFTIIRHRPERPYTFLTFADRGDRKGWNEVWSAFYKAFGGSTTGEQGVRIIVKSIKNDVHFDMMEKAEGADKRFVYDRQVYSDIKTLYSQADCLVLPSRSEGWGMIHREAACMGLPVITQEYSGLGDDGNLGNWATPLVLGKLHPIPPENNVQLGEWMIADIDELATAMQGSFQYREESASQGLGAAYWIRQNQTWDHTVLKLWDLIEENSYAANLERTTLSVP